MCSRFSISNGARVPRGIYRRSSKRSFWRVGQGTDHGPDTHRAPLTIVEGEHFLLEVTQAFKSALVVEFSVC